MAEAVVVAAEEETVEVKRTRGACGRLLNQAEAQAVDEFLFTAAPVEQLMELAGFACACVVPEVYPVERYPRVLIICGPGNNGGDGLVAARHLQFFGYKPTVLYPKQPDKPLYKNLCTQLGWNNIPIVTERGEGWEDVDVIMDCIFGFSFKGAVREPFGSIVRDLAAPGRPPVISVDIPSGWDVETGPPSEGPCIQPEVLLSLSAPKMCTEHFLGRHFLGGRFIPPNLIEKYQLELPPYPGTSQIVELPAPASKI
mmetsp:Transcript_61785/g.110265  ORF Transcript_61785/g.110265 Transcript_61785/m.110265 type:complete len:255 (-) Transcript_61785:19-783(-)